MSSAYRTVSAATITGWADRCRQEMRRAETIRYCVICGEREGSSYAKHCCADPDNMIDDGSPEED